MPGGCRLAGHLPDKSPIACEVVQPAELKLLTNYVEGGGNYLALTNGFAIGLVDMREASPPRETISGVQKSMVSVNSATGSVFRGGRHLQLQPRLVRLTHSGTSAGGFFWPRFRRMGS